MKKVIFISTFLSILFLTTLICSAAPTLDKFNPVPIDLGTIDADFSWPLQDYAWPDSQDNTYRLSFEVDSKEEVNLTINSTKSMKIWFFNAKEQTWSSSDTGSWTKMFETGSYQLDIYGEAISLKTRRSMARTASVPIPGALILFGSGVSGLFLIRRAKQFGGHHT